ncbi:MAG: glycoside hydrolase family 9 protein [Flavobacteriales bacterium]
MRFLLSFIVGWICSLNIHAQTPIKIDQFGYECSASKVAVLSNPEVGFNASDSYVPADLLEVRRVENDEVVFSAAPVVWNNGNTHAQSGDKGWWFDFSELTEPGEYYIYDSETVTSGPFVISSEVYGDVLKASMRMFYYNRCNSEKLEMHAGANWADGNNFLNPLQDSECRYFFDQDNLTLQRDMRGGWFDAGDFNKYVTFAEFPIHNLLWAYQENPAIFTDESNIPESGNGIPDILDELKWELDWLLKMTNADGSTHIKMGSDGYGVNTESPPSLNTDQRFYGLTCTSASLSAASALAHSAEVFSEVEGLESYSLALQSQAELCFNYALPFITNQTLETECDNGEIVAGDADRTEQEQINSAVIAAVHLLSLTGNSDYENFISNQLNTLEPIAVTFWGPYNLTLQDALLYYTSLESATTSNIAAILNSISTDSSTNFNDFFGFSDADLYRAYMPDWSYHWGSNSPKAGYGILNALLGKYGINLEQEENYKLKMTEQLHYFHGVNPLGKVMLSNMYGYGAEDSMNEIYHGWFDDGTDYDNALTSPLGPAPGYVVGGPNNSFSVTDISPPSGQPIQKAYLDWNTGFPENSWEISEPSISYQAIYVRLLAAVHGSIIQGTQNDECDENAILGCTYIYACNYTAEATKDNGSCEFVSCSGCTYQYAINFDETALLDDGSCIEPVNCLGDFNQDNIISITDLSGFLAAFGTFCN